MKFYLPGVMAAQGILNNPAMFAGYDQTPLQCVSDWVSMLHTSKRISMITEPILHVFLLSWILLLRLEHLFLHFITI